MRNTDQPIPMSGRLRAVGVLLMVFVLLLGTGWSLPETRKAADFRDCLGCHQGIEAMGEPHDFPCAKCHLRPEIRSTRALYTHEAIIRNPSDPVHVEEFCLPCHQEEIRCVKTSLHATMAGIINQTRYLWGAQERSFPAVYGLSGGLKPLPGPDPGLYTRSPRRLVDDFLRRRCLRCHIHTQGGSARGLYRAGGCAACHVLYGNDGRYRGGDRAIDQSLTGYPLRHEFTRNIPTSQCLHCHNRDHVGADYEGLFGYDYSDTYRAPMKEGRRRPMIYGMDYHHLAKDIHAQKGLWCTDCHGRGEVMGKGPLYSYEMEVPKVSCPDCHGGFDRPGPDPARKAVHRESGRFLFVSRNGSRRHVLPLFSREAKGHNIEEHERVRCSACHAQWAYHNLGLSVIREDVLDGHKWHDLTHQGDPYLQKILQKSLRRPGPVHPFSKDHLSGETRPGLWSAGWRFRRWEPMPLGVDHRERYALLRPLYQYLITYVDRLGHVPVDSVVPARGDGSGPGWAFTPYVPHTISPFGRPCVSCHLNRGAAGLGIQDKKSPDTSLFLPSPPALPTMRLLGPEERKKLLDPSERWHRERLRALSIDR